MHKTNIGGVSERPKDHAWKALRGEIPTRVRISPPPLKQKYMTEQLITAATIYRKKRGGSFEWLVVKPNAKTPGELPKGPVRRGESSVGAILRILREDSGMTVEVKEESGRFNQGTSKFLYYLIEATGISTIKDAKKQEKWGQYSQVAKFLGTDREKKMLSQAKDVLKELQKVKKN